MSPCIDTQHTLEFVKQYLAPNAKILEVGSGAGRLAVENQFIPAEPCLAPASVVSDCFEKGMGSGEPKQKPLNLACHRYYLIFIE